jgi:hypothetical protein
MLHPNDRPIYHIETGRIPLPDLPPIPPCYLGAGGFAQELVKAINTWMSCTYCSSQCELQLRRAEGVLTSTKASCRVISPPASVAYSGWTSVSQFFLLVFSHLLLERGWVDGRHCFANRYLGTMARSRERVVSVPCRVGAQPPKTLKFDVFEPTRWGYWRFVEKRSPKCQN